MRLPVSKVYRAFPELDRFSDQQCRDLLRTVNRRWGSRLLMTLLCCVLGVISFFVTGFFLALFLAPVADLFGFGQVVVALFTVVMIVSVPAYTATSVRDSWLRRQLKRLITSANCPCGYSLLGLPVSGGSVKCPECGNVIFLKDRDLTPEQILAGTRDPRPASE